MCKKILEWGWCYKNSEHANGPFSFKEAAIANARNEFEFELKREDVLISVGHIKYASSGEIIRNLLDVDTILEQMDEIAKDNGLNSWDGEIFEMKGSIPHAKMNLELVLHDWAKKYVTSNVGYMEYEEAVLLRRTKKEKKE